MMNLCRGEGGKLNAPAYFALRDELSWDETGRIMTSLTILGDEDANYNEWFKKNHERATKQVARQAQAQAGSAGESHAPTIEVYQRELDDQRQGWANVQEQLRLHRVAVLGKLGEAEGLLPPDQIEWAETCEEIHALKIEQIEAAIIAQFGE